MAKYRPSLQFKFLLSIAFIIFPTLGIIFVWAGFQLEKQAMGQILNQARALVRQIILTRQWVSDCGGVFVRRESDGAKQTVYFYDDRMETQRGIYQRFTPSMVTKKLSQYSLRQDLYQFRPTSLNPLNPRNRPDEFERRALTRFKEEGLSEVYRIMTRNNRKHLQYMVPLLMDHTCLKCHQQQGLSKGAIGGGLSIILPLDEMKSSLTRDYVKLTAFGIGLIFLTVFTLFVLLRLMVIRPLNALEEMTGKISEGCLDARVDIRTGDEFEKLGYSFNSMAKHLSQNRDILEERISQATHELAEANRELQSVDKLKSDFLANVSHELRSPLTVLRGSVDYLNRVIEGDENKSYLNIIDKNLARLIHLVSDLFDFTKLEAGKVEWVFERENVSELVEEVLEILSPLATEKGISLHCDHADFVFAEIDLERIQQVLVNLVENAIKYSGPETEIRIHIEEIEDSFVVQVKDQGPGIPIEHQELIFEKFRTLPSSKTRGKDRGTGLGLAICKGIIQGHGGRIWLESIPGKGSSFFFALPKERSQKHLTQMTNPF